MARQLRSLTLTLLLAAAPAFAQDITPIHGYVFDNVTGKPVANATVHYRGDGANVQQGQVINPPTLQGQVHTADDGSYTLPNLPSGNYRVHADAPGFLADALYAQPGLAGEKFPFGVIKYDLHLKPNLLALHPMSETALVKFRLPCCLPQRFVITQAFTPDASRFVFISLDSFVDADPKTLGNKTVPRMTQCNVWSYDLVAETIDRATLPNDFCTGSSDISVGKGTYKAGATLLWLDGSFYLTFIAPLNSNKPVAAYTPPVTILVLHGSSLLPVASSDRPPALQAKIADLSTPKPYVEQPPITDDHRYSLDLDSSDEHSSCDSLDLVNLTTHRSRTVASGCSSYLVDTARDLFFANEGSSPKDYSGNTGPITELSMTTGVRRIFQVPVAMACGGGSSCSPRLLALQALPNADTRIAYSVGGDCDPASSDYTQPPEPDNPLGETPNKFSVCFITIPYTPHLPKPAAPAPAKKAPAHR